MEKDLGILPVEKSAETQMLVLVSTILKWIASATPPVAGNPLEPLLPPPLGNIWRDPG